MNCTLHNSRKISGLHFTTKHTGKMAGMVSISTSVARKTRRSKAAYANNVLQLNKCEYLQVWKNQW